MLIKAAFYSNGFQELDRKHAAVVALSFLSVDSKLCVLPSKR